MSLPNSSAIDTQAQQDIPLVDAAQGLTQAEATQRLLKYGPNALPVVKTRLWLKFLKKIWGPVPWMLELCLVLEVISGKYIESAIIGALILFNAVMSTLQENKAQNALALLKDRLSVNSRALRDGKWQTLPSRELVPGDMIYLRMGDLIPADTEIVSGQISIDQSTLTGESLAVEADAGASVFAGTTVVRGEAAATVTQTGIHTRFGKTAELVRLAKTTGQLERIVFAIVRYLVILDIALVVILLIYALITKLPMQEMLPFSLILLVSSVPVALPATFTVATALGAVTLAKNGVLVTRLSAIEEAASMQVLCTDKTGTLTENHLEVVEVVPFSPFSQEDVLKLALMASDAATQDPLDQAIFKKATAAGVNLHILENRISYIPFEPATKRAEAVFEENGANFRVLKGAPQVIGAFDSTVEKRYPQLVEKLSAQGLRVLAVASGTDHEVKIAGLLAFQDPPRADSANLIERLKGLGIRVVMITGDGLSTAKSIAVRLGINGHASLGETLQDEKTQLDEETSVYAEVLPEEKFRLVKKFQQTGKIVGMTGDGVNDAPALKQAEVGVAVSNATDVAKAAASLVLTTPGLSNLVAAIETSRCIYQRMLTYTLNKIIKTIEIVFFLSLGLILFRTFVTTPLLMILLIFTNDFVTMSISTDHVKPSPQPNRWNVRSIVFSAVLIALPILALSFAIFWYGNFVLKLPLANLQTLLFVMLVYSGQTTIYLIRERGHFWRSFPSKWMLIGTALDILVVGFLASQGILMTAIPLSLVLKVFLIIVTYIFLLDFIKVPIFRKLQLT
jgi:H+-transporting ATPase